MATENMSVAECPGCGQKVRFPTDRGFIKFKCPACSRGLEWGTPEPLEVMDVVFEGDDAPSTSTQNTTASFYDAVKAAAPAQASPATASPTCRTAQSATSTEHKPRLLAFAYFAASVALGVATYWLERQTDGEDLYMLLFVISAFSTYYLFFRGIRVATRFGVGGSIATLVGASFLLSLAIPYIQNLDIGGSVSPFGSDELAEGHFKGASKNTTPSEMDDLMEDW